MFYKLDLPNVQIVFEKQDNFTSYKANINISIEGSGARFENLS